MSLAFVGLGSNIDPEQNLHRAARFLRRRFSSAVFSPVYRSQPLLREDQPPFLNAVARFETEETPEAVLATLRKIEQRLAKNPPFRFGPRTIDLDLLLYGDLILSSPELLLPHPRMHERRFVLEPLCELLPPQGKHPLLETSWEELHRKTLEQSCEETGILL